ncbi:MAG TPA: SIMPL domain-containing protein [Gemmatimonadales bacterium]
MDQVRRIHAIQPPRTWFLRAAAIVGALSALALPGIVHAQSTPPQPTVPEITASAYGEVKSSPDRATILFSVETRGATAAEASSANAEKQQAVIAALRGAGLPEDAVKTVSYTIEPEMQYEEATRRSRVVGYVARNTVSAEVRELDRMGRVIDAAVRAGSNGVSSLDFWTTRREALRLEALQGAMSRACREAQTMAAAAGGSLGPLLQASTADYDRPYPPPMPMMARMEAAAAADTPIVPGDVSVRVNVQTRWQFVPAGVAAPAGSATCR